MWFLSPCDETTPLRKLARKADGIDRGDGYLVPDQKKCRRNIGTAI